MSLPLSVGYVLHSEQAGLDGLWNRRLCVCVFASGSFHPLRFMGAFATLRVASLGIYSPCFFDRSNNPTVKKEPSPLNSPVPRNEL